MVYVNLLSYKSSIIGVKTDESNSDVNRMLPVPNLFRVINRLGVIMTIITLRQEHIQPPLIRPSNDDIMERY